MRMDALALATVVACTAPFLLAGAPGSPFYPSGYSATNSHCNAVPRVTRDFHGKIARSPQAWQQFKKAQLRKGQ